MTDHHQHQIGTVIGADETNDNHPDYSSRLVVVIYIILTLPIIILSVGLAYRNNWSTDYAAVVFAGVWMAFTVLYIATVLGITIKLLKVALNFIFRMYVVNRQFEAHKINLSHETEMYQLEWQTSQVHVKNFVPAIEGKPAANIPLLTDSSREQFIAYLKTLYENVNDTFVNIHTDGRIKNRVPWSNRAGILEESKVKEYVRLGSWKANQPLLYYNKNGWYVNITAYPTINKALFGFFNKNSVADEPYIQDGEWRFENEQDED